MKNYILSSLFILFLIFSLPLTVIRFGNGTSSDISDSEASDSSQSLRVLRVSTGDILTLDFHEYLIGAVAAEMPASFSEEALKAQTVACYTYALWIVENSDRVPEEIFDISDDSNKHQGYITKEVMKEKWGDKFDKYYKKIENAVSKVYGEYLSFSSEPAMTVYHALSSGKTASCEELWGYDIPYLISVDAPGDKLSPDLISENIYTKDEFNTIAAKIIGEKNFSDIDTDTSDCTQEGYLNTMKINGTTISCTDVRSAFSLKSTRFSIKLDKNTVTFTVYGKGHNIGMSQYSADFMARQGSDYKEILAHFYPGTEIKTNKHLQNSF